jgi:uncharacterized repeat protein (TIGR01451 family)
MIRMLVRAIAFAWLALAALPAAAATYTVNSSGDSWINEASTAQNNGTVVTLRATASSTGTSRTRALIAFTLPAIPSNETITSAVLKLRVTTAGSQVVNVHRVTDTWTETTVTWANTATDFNATSSASFTPSTVNVTLSIDITALVQGWRAGTFTNYGVMLLGANNSLAQFASEEATTTTNRPQLVITTALISPSLTVVKSSTLLSDPFNNATNPKAIPGAVVRYTVAISNSTAGTADSNVVVDNVPAGMKAFVGDLGGVGSGPVIFTNGPTSSGLSYTYTSLASTTDSVSFSNNGGVSFAYTPVPDASGYDVNVTHIKISPTGSFAGKTGATDPSVSMQVQMQVR